MQAYLIEISAAVDLGARSVVIGNAMEDIGEAGAGIDVIDVCRLQRANG